jgi:ATP-binding cassette subfamily F protein uup
METLDVLEDMIGEYPGMVLLISHDRDFLDRLVSGVIAPEGDGIWTEYAGGYSDMLMQRGADLTRTAAAAEPERPVKKAGAAEPQAAKRKMKFKEKHARETLPKTMAALSAKANELQARLADPQFYSRDRGAFEKVTTDLGETQRKLAAAEEQWLELEILREELAG